MTTTPIDTQETTAATTEEVLSAATVAHAAWSAASTQDRANVVDRVADALEESVDSLVALAMDETHLPEPRLRGEVKRTAFQLRLFGEVLRDGAYLDARIDHADAAWPMGAPRPDLRRSLRAIGPVVVYSASNFPFAFSVIGGDTASALAAGNAVVVKAHEGHARLSRLTETVVRDALAAAGTDPNLVTVIFGRAAGTTVLQDSRIKAAGFTGSIPGGRALMDIANGRPDPIPFYGELGSNNPVFVTQAAAAARGEEIAKGFVESFTMGTGQFCTKPGMLFVPRGSGMLESLRNATLPAVGQMLNPRIEDSFKHALGTLSGIDGVEVLNAGGASATAPAAVLLTTSVERLLADPKSVEEECFGPAAFVVEYDDESQLVEVARTFEGQLTATLQAEVESPVQELVAVLIEKAGRLLWNQWPTGVSVTYAQQHGGPYPATTVPGSTSVGTAAIARFLRPVAFQNFPQHLLPSELRDDNPDAAPRLINGELVNGERIG
ncbi:MULTISPECIES: aldehyde dehydrogenase (NADP(+)) [Arthrobacter]|uniref:Aldehyde dehydrogenase (NADP(+)) n=1 Tax=Arthrobacter terricola TaxID=2547396 RepID=A0A4R5KVH8_9MICC|nr:MULTISPECIES: aldehyde dehydrogenase (NADP(+)) [Arthrobacter]MBT8159785.1 aldehyde dehydrogenase (NADP(+)) [Arthrobacter sp. GN70]TDF99115.1 aldehyde dehydrogenase (NADP(+)) [Arthrobacter terricola]